MTERKASDDHPIRVLFVLPSLNLCGGIESFAMNYYRNVGEGVSIDFVTHECLDTDYRDEIAADGSRVSVLPPFRGRDTAVCLRAIENFFEEHGEYDIVHCHMANASPFYFAAALRHGIGVRVLHSHQDNYADTPLHALRNIPLIRMGDALATHRAACSAQAGDFLFRGKTYHIIRNAIDPGRYAFDEGQRRRLRREMDLSDDTVLLGTVGRLTEQKNPAFLLRLMSKLPERYALVYVGEGHLEKELRAEVGSLGLSERVIFAGSTSEVESYLSAMDVFVLPSIYEGLGIVNIEAQASGLPVIVSDRVPRDADMGELFTGLSLDAPMESWARAVAAACESMRDRADPKWIMAVRDHGYDIHTEGVRLSEYYRDIIREAK